MRAAAARAATAVAVIIAPLPGSPAEPGRATLAGSVRLILAEGVTAPAPDTVVWVAGALSPAARGSRQPPAVASRDKRFDPHVLVVTRGATVTFPNVDKIFHNAFSRTPGSAFDLGLYRRGASRAYTFRSAGLVHVYCNIHSEMAAYVMVVDPADAFAITDGEGRFELADLPAGHQVLHVWNEKGGGQELALEAGVGAPAPLEVVLDASTYRPQPHTNKFGKDYPPATKGVDRY